MSDPSPVVPLTLADFEGKSVVEVGIEIPGAAGGLREAMKIDPVTFTQGETTFVVLQCKVGKVRFEPIDKDYLDGDQRRVHVFTVEGATMVDGDLVREHLDAQAERILLAREAAQGITRLPMEQDGVEFDLALVHADGGHASGLVDGCPVCRAEVEAGIAEANTPTPINGRKRRK